MDAKTDILGTGQIKTSPEQQARLNQPLPTPVSPVQVAQHGQGEQVKPQSLDAPDEVKPKRLSYTEMFQMLNPYEQKTPEELAKEKKRDRSRRIISAIGDGISALSNLYFTTKGAPNAYTGQNTLSAAYQKRRDSLNAQRNTEHDKWMSGYLNAVQMDDSMNWRDKVQAYKEGRDKLADSRYESGQKAAGAAAELKYQRDLTLQKINHAFQMGMLDTRAKQDLEKQAAGAKNQKELLALGHKYKLEEINAGKKVPAKKTDKNTKFLKLRYEGPNGETQYYDMNEDVQVAKMYNEGVRAGYFKEIEGKQPTVKQMRDIIIGSTGRWKEGNSVSLNNNNDSGEGWSLNGSDANDEKDGWSLK